MAMKKALGKKNSVSNGTVMSFACNCMTVCNIGCTCGTTDASTTNAQNLAKVVSNGMQMSTWSSR